MEAIFILVPVSVLIVLGALATFIWSVYHHQFDDLEKEAQRILSDDQSED